MTRSHVREGFRRIGFVLGAVCAVASIIWIVAVRDPLASHWVTVKAIAIVTPVAWWIGALPARVLGFVVAGFFPPGPPVTHIEAVEEYLLKQPEFSSPQFRLVIKVRDFLSPYAMYAFWVASWLAASWAAKLAGRWWEGEYGETMPFEWLWTARLAALAGALIVLVGGGAIIAHWFVPEMVLHWPNPVDEQPPPQLLWNEEKRD